MQFTLGQWLVFPAENKLVNQVSHQEIHLEPKSMAALKLFIQAPGDVIGIEDFMRVIWQGRVVGDHAVYRAINQLRKNLNPDDKNAYIINIPKQGYKLIEPVHLLEPESVLEHVGVKQNKLNFKYMLFALLVSIIVVLVYWQLNQSKPTPTPFKSYQLTLPLTTDLNNEMDPHFSPDGSFMVYTKQLSPAQQYHVFILNLATNEDVKITETTSTNNESNPVISAGADRLVFIRRSAGKCQVMLINKPLTEQANESELFECDWQNLDLEISEDGQMLYYTQATEPNNQHKIYAMAIDTGKTIQLTTIKNVNSQGDRIISLSPDNKKLAFLRDNEWKWSDIGTLDLVNYEEAFYIKTASWFNSLGWTQDSKHIIYQDNNRSLSMLSLEDGRNEKITSGFTEDILAISHNSVNSDLAIAFGQKKGGITIKPNPLIESSDESEMNEMLVQSTEVDAFPSFANQSKQMAFMSKRSGAAQIWLKKESGEEEQITRYTDQRSVRTIRWSPDDTALLTENQGSISLININDKTEHILIAENQYGSVGGATWNHDGSGIYFSSDISGNNQIYQLDIASGAIKQITTKGGNMALPSPEQHELYVLKTHQTGLITHNLLTGEEQVRVEEIDINLHRSIQVKSTGIYFASLDGRIKKFDYSNQRTIDIDVGTALIVPVLTVSDDESFFAFPYYNKNETSIYLLSH